MASTTEFVGFILERLDLLGDVTAKKMFGEYGVYYHGKFFGVICDNRFLIKITEGGQAYLGDYNTDLPYPGGQPMLLIEDLDDKAVSYTHLWNKGTLLFFVTFCFCTRFIN